MVCSCRSTSVSATFNRAIPRSTRIQIWPSYYAYLIMTASIANPLLGLHPFSLADLWPGLANVQNYFGTPFGHTWSLAVEEHFYLLLPLLLVLIWQASPKGSDYLPWVLVCIILTIGIVRVATLAQVPFGNSTHQWPTHIRADSLLFGVLLSYLYHFKRLGEQLTVRLMVTLSAIALLLLLPMFKLPLGERQFVHLFGYTLNYLAYGIILIVAIHTAPTSSTICSGLLNRIATVLSIIGTYSYSIYLCI